ncbi:MAG TPA: hypothetical protein VII62_00035 [Vicinamibacteria bacterium]|jgi:hypothetical protein
MNRSLAFVCAAFGLALIACGGSTMPSGTSGPPVVTLAPAPTPTPTSETSVVLPPGMVCPAPTPPPMLRMHVSLQAQEGERRRLDSKPLVPNIDHYCDKVGFGDWKFCDTRPEGNKDRVACDYLATGKAENGRWGPTWFFGNENCGYDPSHCQDHPDNQFLAIGKLPGTYEACAAENVPVDPNGSRCGTLEVQ